MGHCCSVPNNKVHGANVGPIWVLSAPDGPHDGPMNLAIRGDTVDDHDLNSIAFNSLRSSDAYSDNGLSPVRRQAIIWTNAGTFLIGSLGTNFSEIVIEIYIFSFNKLHLKMSSAKWRPSCLGLNVLSGSLGGIIAVQAVQLPSTANWFKGCRHYCTTLKLRDFSFVYTVLNHHRDEHL